MKIQNPFRVIILLLTFSILATSCSKTEDIPQDVEVNDFIWGGMNAYYKWQGEVPDLSDRKFSTRTQLNSYLSGFSDSEQFFYSLNYRRGDVDRFSWIVDDYIALENSFQGIRLTSGMKVVVINYADGSDRVFALIRDVVAGSDADAKGIQRGMYITEINGTQLTSGNVRSLFDNNSFTITTADYNGGNPTANGTTFDLIKTQVTENPVKITKVINQGAHKIGYIMYNQFSRTFDKELNAAFASLKGENITDLVVDLRYNGGGSVRTAVYLASMITGQFNTQVFSQQIWNDKVIEAFKNRPGYFENNFTDKIENRDANNNVILSENINSLNQTSVYFIVSDRTASASELVINGLKPYIGVNLVGTQTVGKQVGSITLYDSDNYTKNGEGFNNNHTWAMQPIVLEIQNKDGDNEPNGYIPDVIIEEDTANLGVLGDPTEPLLARTIQLITTGSKTSTRASRSGFNNKAIWNSEMQFPDYNNMYVDF